MPATDPSLRVQIDCTSTRPLRTFWRSTGFSPAKLLLSADMRQQMAYAGSLPHGGIRHVRIHYLLELVRAEGLGTDAPRYDWSALDAALDVLARHRLAPFFELMGNPSGFFTDFTDRGQIRAWRDLVRDLARHLMDRYGAEEVRTWYFETWNEPDGWWTQSHQAFFNYYDACSEGLKEADPAIRFGGPGSCRNLSSLFKGLMAHCDTGTNGFTGETGVRIDFISTHEKGAGSCSEDIDPDSLHIIRQESATYDYLRRHHPRLARLPLMNNECDPQVGWWDLHTWRGKAYHAALAVKIIRQHEEAFGDAPDLDYALLSNDHGFVGAWGNRTLMARFGEIADDRAQGEYKAADGEAIAEDPARRRFAMVKKPVLSVMGLLAMLGDRRCEVRGVPSSLESDLGVMATRHGDDQIAVLVYHSRDRIMSSGIREATLEVEGVPFPRGMLVEYRIEDGFTDPFAAWAMRGHRRTPTLDDLVAMRDAAEVGMAGEPRNADLADGRLVFSTAVPLPSVRLFLLTRQPHDGPEAVGPPEAEVYEGLHEEAEDVLLTWPGLPSRAIRTYVVEAAEAEDGPWRRINAPDTLCTAWLHTRPRGTRSWYRIRAVDFWDRPGEPSAPLHA